MTDFLMCSGRESTKNSLIRSMFNGKLFRFQTALLDPIYSPNLYSLDRWITTDFWVLVFPLTDTRGFGMHLYVSLGETTLPSRDAEDFSSTEPHSPLMEVDGLGFGCVSKSPSTSLPERDFLLYDWDPFYDHLKHPSILWLGLTTGHWLTLRILT